jgi:hypothetical protein
MNAALTLCCVFSGVAHGFSELEATVDKVVPAGLDNTTAARWRLVLHLGPVFTMLESNSKYDKQK